MCAMQIRFDKPGDASVLYPHDIEPPAPGALEVTLRQTAVGLNFIDTYHRSGLYPLPLPSGLGMEAAGIIEICGAEVGKRYGLSVGDRVAYGSGPIGAYASSRTMTAARLIKLPESIDDTTAAAMMLKGMTARYLLRKTYPVAAGETILFHAAAGGVGLIACQWAKAIGATLIGTVGSDEKAALAKAHGCAHTINIRTENLAERVRELTDGKGVAVVYDSIGKDSFAASLDCLRPRGLMVTFGNSSGATGPIDPLVLSQKGSLFLTRPTLAGYVGEENDYRETIDDLFAMVGSGKIKISINQSYPLADAAQAHRDLEGRKTTGATVLIP